MFTYFYAWINVFEYNPNFEIRHIFSSFHLNCMNKHIFLWDEYTIPFTNDAYDVLRTIFMQYHYLFTWMNSSHKSNDSSRKSECIMFVLWLKSKFLFLELLQWNIW